MSTDPGEKALKDLLAGMPVEILSAVPEITVRGITPDSRQVQEGSLFVAVKGDQVDGHKYIAQAVERGAAAVLGSHDLEGIGVPYIRTADSRRALAYAAANWYGTPGRKLTVIGVTGTDGKTTTSNLIFNILQAAGYAAGMISTVNAQIGEIVLDTGFHVTTPDPLDVQRYLDEMVQAGLTHVVLEATSHGLAQHRVDGSEFDIGVVTNITHEHLDFHGSYENYRAAKGRLFTLLGETAGKPSNPPRGAVLNRDDSSYDYLAPIVPVRAVSYGMHPEAQVRAVEIGEDGPGIRFTAEGEGSRFRVETPLEGLFNVANCLAAIAATVVLLGIPPEAAQAGLAAMRGVPGRMERLDVGQPFTAIVDFAHTPFALEAALRSARSIARRNKPEGRVIAVFGSAGLRDRLKRRMMAETSAELADLTILTAEDPRTEPLEAILAEMAAGAERRGGIEGKSFWRIPDRGEALRFAVGLARPGDVVIACGKGHEQSMCFGATEFAWDDRTALMAALSERYDLPGPIMPVLPTSKD